MLANSSVLKVGVGIDDDAIGIWQHYGYETLGRLDLGGVKTDASTRGQVGLRSLALTYLRVELKKSNSVTTSNWEARPLSLRQLDRRIDFWSISVFSM